VMDLLSQAAPATAVAAAAEAPIVDMPVVQPTPAPGLRAPIVAQSDASTALVSASPDSAYYNSLRRQMRWVPIRFGGSELKTPDLNSRMLLARSAAQRAGLHEVGLNYRDVYGIINAETSWVPRTGASKDGTPNHGIAQFEPATARALGLTNPNDPVESVHVMALHLKEAAEWSQGRLSKLKLNPAEYATKLREGISIYYNLSSKGRAAWNGRNTSKLPRETQLHIRNARLGAQQAAVVDAQLAAQRFARRGPATVVASLGAQSASN
jgi:hypothetical protein